MKKVVATSLISLAALSTLLFGRMDAQAANTAQQGTIVGVTNYTGINESRKGITTAEQMPLYEDASKKQAATKPPVAPNTGKTEISRSKKTVKFLGIKISQTEGNVVAQSYDTPTPTQAAVNKAKKEATAKKNLAKPQAPQASKVPSDAVKDDDKNRVAIQKGLRVAEQKRTASNNTAMEVGYGGKMDKQVHVYRGGQAPKTQATKLAK